MINKELLARTDHLLAMGRPIEETKWVDSRGINRVDYSKFQSFRAASLSFVHNLFGSNSVYFREFDKAVNDNYLAYLKAGLGILEAIRNEIEQGWLESYKGLIAAELFSDFLEMSEHLLDEGYDDAAAVMIGSVLEEHLRQLCYRHKVDVYYQKGLDEIAKKADILNVDLKKGGAYGPSEQKQITAWLGIRNSAAHGKYSEYTIEQVRLFYQGVLDFISRIR